MNPNSRDEVLENAKTFREIEAVIQKALNKVNTRSHNVLCRYLPGSEGGYMHHFTMRKMMKRQPQVLGSMIEKFIINVTEPSPLPPKPRAARGSRKRRDQISLSRSQIDRMLNCARAMGDKDVISMLATKRPLAVCKRELISSIRHGLVEPELWNAYVEASAAYQQSIAPVKSDNSPVN